MEVFGMTSESSPSRHYYDDEDDAVTASFDYLRDATSKQNTSKLTNESISFLLDTSAIAHNTTAAPMPAAAKSADEGSLASTKEKKAAFYSLHDTAVSEFLSSPKRRTSPSKSPKPKSNTTTNNRTSTGSSNHRFQSKLPSPKASGRASSSPRARNSTGSTNNPERRLSPLPMLNTAKPQSPNNTRQAQRPRSINTRRSLSTQKGGVASTTLQTPASGTRRGSNQRNQQPASVPQTPGGFWTTNTESKTFVNGLLSPFSPLLHSTVHKNGKGSQKNFTSGLATMNEDAPAEDNGVGGDDRSVREQLRDQRREFLQYVSLQPCRKVSVVVRVASVTEGDDAKRCIFPHFQDNLLNGGNTSIEAGFSTPLKSLSVSNAPGSSPTSFASSNNRLASPTHRRDVVVVNPTAFGRYIPSQVTMETAKLVAQVANIASEDWARLYEFHHVMWPTPTKGERSSQPLGSPTSSPKKNEDLSSSFNTMDSLSRAVVQDLLAEHESSLLISLGHESSCFGTSESPNDERSIGLWPKIMNQCAAFLEAKGVVRLTMVEILEPTGHKTSGTTDSFRDLLAPTDEKPTAIHLRHIDMKGAILEGLTEVELDSMPALLEALAKSRQRRAQRRRNQGKQQASTATAVIGTLHYWEHAVSYELGKPSNATVTCVELANHHLSPSPKGGDENNQNRNGKKNVNNKNNAETLESIAHRKNAVSLGQALRQLLLQQAHGHEEAMGLTTSELAPVVSYRETTLTKVLQRAMESSKIVLIASISPLSKDYDNTVVTLNYLRRLLVKPGNTLTSPFGGRNNQKNKSSTPKTAKTDNRSLPTTLSNNINNNTSLNASTSVSINRSILTSPEAKEQLSVLSKDTKHMEEQMVADPRQRLARLFGSSPSPQRRKNKPWSNVLDRMEDAQLSTRGTPTAISLGDVSSNRSTSQPNSYAGPEETRQVVESPGSAQQSGQQPRQSWQPEEEDDEDDAGVADYEISYDDPRVKPETESDSDEWASEEEIERELLMSARLKERSLQTEIDELENTLQGQEDLSDEEKEEGGLEEAHQTNQNNVMVQQYNEEGNLINAIEVDLQGNSNERDMTSPLSDPVLEEINPEGSYYDNEEVEEALEYDLPPEEDPDLPKAPTDLSEMINNHLEEEFADPNQGGLEEQDEEHTEGESLGLQPIKAETVEGESLLHVEDHHQPLFTNEEWQGEAPNDGSNANGTNAPESNEPPSPSEESHRTPPSGFLDLDPNHADDEYTLDPGQQTNYDLPDEPLPVQERIQVQASTPPIIRPQLSPFGQRSAVNAYASPYSISLKTSKSREYIEREGLRNTVASLKEQLKTVEENRDSTIVEYEEQIQKMFDKLNEAAEKKRELENLANQAIAYRTTQEQVMEANTVEREELQRTVDALRRDLAEISETHENSLRHHRSEIDDFQSRLSTAMEHGKEVEDIADEAVTAHKTQVEETRVLAFEREELKGTIEDLQSKIKIMEKDQDNHLTKYQQEIRQLRATLEESMKDKRTLEQEANDFRFRLETQSEKVRMMNKEREELHTTLSSVKGKAQKASGDHTEYLRRLKHEIQQLHTKLDETHSEKLRVEKAADEIRFTKDDLERRVKTLEEELSSSRANTSRLEGIRRDEQDTIRKLNAELHRKESEKTDMDHFRNELERLQRHKDHLESEVAHRKLESSANLRQLEEELAEAKRKNRRLEEELSSVRMELSASQKQKGEVENRLRSALDSLSELKHKLSGKDKSLERIQANCDQLESLRTIDKGVIAKLNEELQGRDKMALDMDAVHRQLSRLKHDHDYLQRTMDSRKSEYERSMEDKANEVSAYMNQVESLKADLKKVATMDQTYRTDAEAQLRSLQVSESNLIQNLRHRDDRIDHLKNEISTQREEIASLRQKETSASNAEHEVARLQDRLTKLESLIEITTKEREDAVRKAKAESRSHRSMAEELKQSKDEIHRYKNTLEGLNKELDQRQGQNIQAQEKIFQMELELRSFKKETRDRASTLKDSVGVLERTRTENRDLTSNLKDMNEMIQRLTRERNICFESLKDGQKKLSELSSKNSLTQREDLFSTAPTDERGSPRRRGPRSAPRSSRPPLESITARASNHRGSPLRTEPRTTPRTSYPPLESITARAAHRMIPEIYVSNYDLGSPTTIGEERAEEIAACVAQNARNSLEENFEEVSQLRSQIYRLEDERSEQVSALKNKVRNLQRELTYEREGQRTRIEDDKNEQIFALEAKVRNLKEKLTYERVGSRTPVMGSARRLRKQNYFMDWDEKMGY